MDEDEHVEGLESVEYICYFEFVVKRHLEGSLVL